MIRRIFWAQPSMEEPQSPFARGVADRKIKITLHSESFSDAPNDELKAIHALRELSNLPDIDVADTVKSDLPYLEIESLNKTVNYLLVRLEAGESSKTTAIRFPEQWLNISKSLTKKSNSSDPEVQRMLALILIMRAHYELRHDLFITLSPHIFQHCDKNFIREVNPSTPLEAIKIVGLYLRFRENYVIEASGKGTHSLNRGLFYLILARHRLPRMWKYFSACVYADKVRKDETLNLGGSILTRSTRILMARDHIGFQYYNPDGNDSTDIIMYHFDYLTLLLSGAFDAQARIARRAYGIKKPDERNLSFRRDIFAKALGKYGAMSLKGIITSERFVDLMILLSELRNTIHAANLNTLSYLNTTKEGITFVVLNGRSAQRIWEAAKRYSSPENWGLFQDNQILFEPYTYSITLINEGFKYINAIANSTDVVKLFPSGTIPRMTGGPPKKGVFVKGLRKRVHLLG